MEWGPEIPLDVSSKPDWLPGYLPIVRIARSALVPPDSWYPAGLSRGEWAATKAIQLPAGSALYDSADVMALMGKGEPAPGAPATSPDLESRVKALEADVAALKARG
jgi:hypothetical protein